MFLIVEKSTKAVIHITEFAVVAENGIDVGDRVFGRKDELDLIEVPDADIPADFRVQEYSYDATSGFFKNPFFVPFKSKDEIIAELQAKVKVISDTIDFLLGV